MKQISLILIIALLFFGCATVPVERGGYCEWDEAPSWMVKDMDGSGWGLIDGYGFEEGGNQYWALLLDSPDNGLGECDYWALVVETSYDDRYGETTPLVSVVTIGECWDWDELIGGVKERVGI